MPGEVGGVVSGEAGGVVLGRAVDPEEAQDEVKESVEGREGAPEDEAEENRAGSAEGVVEVRRHRKSRTPRPPTQSEREGHLPLHLPFGSWCPVCVQAAGVHDHRRVHISESEETIGTTIRCDNCFQGNSQEGDDMEDRRGHIILMMILSTALQVETNGVREEVIDWILQKLEEAGRSGSELTLKSNQEAIVALKRAEASRRISRTAPIESQVRVFARMPIRDSHVVCAVQETRTTS